MALLSRSRAKIITMTSYDSPSLLQNPFLHKKWGCFQKLELRILRNDRAMAMLSLKKEI